GSLVFEGAEPVFVPGRKQMSFMIAAMMQNGFWGVLREGKETCSAGEIIDVYPLESSFSANCAFEIESGL
ncbi:MAG: hypothetical protein D6719_00925, partial [Candidatus Dadabacteria bacterium]